MLGNTSPSAVSLTNIKLRLIVMAEERSNGMINAVKKFILTLKVARRISLNAISLVASIERDLAIFTYTC